MSNRSQEGTPLFWAEASTIIVTTALICIEIVWIVRYWSYRKHDFIASRQSTATVCICCGACCYQIWMILFIVWRAWNMMSPKPSQLILSFILFIPIIGGSFYIFMYKSWMLWYNTSLSDALTDIEWLSYISNQNKSNNWFIKNQSTYGNRKYILAFILFILSIFSVLGIVPYHYGSTEYKFIFLIASLLPFIVTNIIAHKVNCVDDIYKIKAELTIYCRLNAVSLLSLYILIFCIQTSHSFLCLIFIFIPSISLFLSVYFQTQFIIKRLKHYISTNSMQNTPISQVSRRFDLSVISSHSPRTTQTPVAMTDISRVIAHGITIKVDPSSPTTSSNPHQHTPSRSFFNITPHRISPTDAMSMDISGPFPDISDIKPSTSSNNNARLLDIIQDPQCFALFMRHVTKEFAFENLLYIVETVQFQQRLIKELERDNENEESKKAPEIPTHLRTPTITDEINNVHSKSIYFKLKDLSLPSSVPHSPIVYGDYRNWFQYLSHMVLPKTRDEEASDLTTADNVHLSSSYNPYKQSVLIYDKYIKPTAALSVNISSEQRKRFNKLFEINFDDKEKKERIYLLPKHSLIDLWEESQIEVWNLLSSSFRRFRKTPVFLKIVSER